MRILFVFLALIVCSCNLFSPTLKGTWHVTKIEAVSSDQESESIFTDSYLSFFSDDVVSFYNSNEHDRSLGASLYRAGNYERDGEGLKFKLNRTTIDLTFSILELTDEWLVLEITNGPKESIGTQLKCQPSDLYQAKSFDLLDPSNNGWRIKADHKESKEEIQQRVSAHLNYMINYFKMVDDKSLGYFEPGLLQSPVGFYSNGIALPDGFATDNKWAPYFFDEEDAVAGGKMLSQGLASIEEYPADGRSYTRGYYNALRLIKEHVDK